MDVYGLGNGYGHDDVDREMRDTQQELRWLRENAQRARWDMERDQQEIGHETQQAAQELRGMQGEVGRGRGRRPRGAFGGGFGGRAGPMDMEDMALYGSVVVAGVLAAFSAVILVVGHIAARVFAGEWPSYPAGEIPGILGRLAIGPQEPGTAWQPVNSGGEVPGAAGFWATFLGILIALGALALMIYSLWPDRKDRAGSHNEGGSSGWGSAKDLPQLAEGEPQLIVGTAGKRTVAINPVHSLLVVGGAHSGKTNGVAIPTLLEWQGPAVVVSNKSHILDETIGWRSRRGDVHVFDPTAASRHQRSGWSLLSDCGTWQGAIRMAQHLTCAAKAAVGGPLEDADSEHQSALWTSAMAMALAPFLYAAAIDGRNVVDVAEWLEREERDEVLHILQPVDRVAAHSHETTAYRDDRSRSEFFHLVFQMLSIYADPVVAETATRHEIIASDMIDGGHHTLYLNAPEHDRVRFQPLFAAIVRQVLTAVNDRFAADGEVLDPPLLLLLDESTAVAGLESVSEVTANGSVKGVGVVTIFKDLRRFVGGDQRVTDLLARNHRAKLMLPGYEAIAARAGAEGALPEGYDQHLERREGALVYDDSHPVHLRLRLWHADDALSERVTTSEEVLTPIERRATVQQTMVGESADYSLIGRPPEYSLVDQTAAWKKRHRATPTQHPNDLLPGRSGDEDGQRRKPRRRNVFSTDRTDHPGRSGLSPGHNNR